jgi:translation initiation factor IF-1
MTPQHEFSQSERDDSPQRGSGPHSAGPRRNFSGPGRGGRGGHRGGPSGPSSHGTDGISDDKEKPIELEGTVTAVLAGTMFRVKLRNGHQVLAHISGKMRKRFIRLVIGDQVKLEMSTYDPDKARIVYRL